MSIQQDIAPDRGELQLVQAELSAVRAELDQLNQFKSFLISMLAHDMRTPLAAIRGYGELLLRLLNSDMGEAGRAKAAGFAGNVCHITDQLTWLINDIIDLNLAEKGLLTVSLESCPIHEILQDTIEMLASIIKLQNLSISLELEPPELLLLADSQRLRQITNNLIGHAIKFSPTGGEISIHTRVEDDSAVLSINDNGRGMTPDEIEKIFQPFYRAKEAKTTNILGSGLGLYIVKTLVEAQNGRIEAAGKTGQGTTFTVYLPLYLE
jgi:signal transduction histidine kinase